MSKPQQKPQPKPLPLQKSSRQKAVRSPRDVPQIRPFTPDRPMPDVARGLPQPLPDRQMPTPPPQQGTPEQRNAMSAYQQANYPIGLGGYLGQPMGPQFGGPDPRFPVIDRLPSRPSTEPMISPETIKKAREEYLASLPKDRKYFDVMTKTKYGGEFGSSIGKGFDKWFEQNYINNPKSSLSEQERMSLQGRMNIPEFGDMGIQSGFDERMNLQDRMNQMRSDIIARNGFALGQIPDAGFYNDPNAKNGIMAGPQFGGNLQFGQGPQFGGPQLGEHKLGYLGSENQLGMGSQFGGMGSQSANQMGVGQDELRKKMMESLLAYNKQSQGNMMGGFGQPIM